MSVTSQCDFYCDLDKINALGEKYQTAIQTLGTMYSELDAAIQEAQANKSLEGEYFNTFLDEFEKWSEWHYRGLAGLILINAGLGSAYRSTESLIQIRNQLADLI